MAKKASSNKRSSRGAKSAPKAPAKRSTRRSPAKAAEEAPKRAGKKAARGEKGRDPSPLSKSQLKEFRRMLLEKRRDLIGDMSGIEAEALRKNRQDGTGDLSNLPTHPADIGTDNYEQEFTLGLLESERVLLEEIDTAVERIENGTFGICLGTGKPIGLARLKARPWAKYCIEYARMLEKGLVKRDEDREAELAGFGDEDEDIEPVVNEDEDSED